MQNIKMTELQLGDIVITSDGEDATYCHATVKNVTETGVTFFRPYVHTGTFSYTGGVICYVGIEEWTVYLPSTMEYVLVRRLSRPLL